MPTDRLNSIESDVANVRDQTRAVKRHKIDVEDFRDILNVLA